MKPARPGCAHNIFACMLPIQYTIHWMTWSIVKKCIQNVRCMHNTPYILYISVTAAFPLQENRKRQKTGKLPPERYNLNLLRSTSVIWNTQKKRSSGSFKIPFTMKRKEKWSQQRDPKRNPMCRWDGRTGQTTKAEDDITLYIYYIYSISFSTSNFKIGYGVRARYSKQPDITGKQPYPKTHFMSYSFFFVCLLASAEQWARPEVVLSFVDT